MCLCLPNSIHTHSIIPTLPFCPLIVLSISLTFLSVLSLLSFFLFSFSFSLFRSLLRSNEVQRDPRQYEQVVQKVIAYMTLGVDVSGLFSEMIMVRSD